jgi:hypothetical protein
MTNNDIFKKLRVALQLRDDQIVEILELVDFRISKGELGNIFRKEDHPNYMECGDQLLRNFLNALVIHLRGTKEEPKNPMEVIQSHKNQAPKETDETRKPIEKPTEKKFSDKKPISANTKKAPAKNFKKKTAKPAPIVEKVRFKNGKNKS